MCVLYDIKFEVINNGFSWIISHGGHTIMQVSILFSLLFSQFYKVHPNRGLDLLDFVFLVVLFCPLRDSFTVLYVRVFPIQLVFPSSVDR